MGLSGSGNMEVKDCLCQSASVSEPRLILISKTLLLQVVTVSLTVGVAGKNS